MGLLTSRTGPLLDDTNETVHAVVEREIFGYSGPLTWTYQVHKFLREHVVEPLFNIIDPIISNLGQNSGDD